MDARESLGERGAQLWDELSTVKPWNAADLVVLTELCRMADRLDRLDALLRGDVDVWARLESRHDGRDHTTVVALDDGLAESRQIAATFQRLASALNLPAKVVVERDGIGDLNARRQARLSG